MHEIRNAVSTHLLVPVVALLLVTAQAMWGTAIKSRHLLEGSAGKILLNLITSPRIWTGVLLYIAATGVYFTLLSRARFFSVQISMTAVAILLSTLLAAVLFHEKISAVNLAGMLLVLIGLALVLAR